MHLKGKEITENEPQYTGNVYKNLVQTCCYTQFVKPFRCLQKRN